MGNSNRQLSKVLAKQDVKIVPCKNNMRGIAVDKEWLKWLSYEPEFEKKRIDYLNSKKVFELSYEELEEVTKYSKNKVFLKLFKMYGTGECSESDSIKLYDYMCNESIEKLMLSKLTSEELQYAKDEINKLSKLTSEELRKKCIIKKETYEKLSMVDAYILHMISNINYVRSNNNLNSEIAAQIEQNDIMRQRSLYYASNRW